MKCLDSFRISDDKWCNISSNLRGLIKVGVAIFIRDSGEYIIDEVVAVAAVF